MMRWTVRKAGELASKAKAHEVTELAAGRYTVVSGTSGNSYTVDLRYAAATCTCDWGKYHEAGEPCTCSHVLAVHKALASGKLNAWATEEDAKRQRRHTQYLGEGIWTTERR